MRIPSLVAALALSLFIGVAHAEGGTFDSEETAGGVPTGDPAAQPDPSGSGEEAPPAEPVPAEPDPAEPPPAPGEPPVVEEPPVGPAPVEPAPVEPAPVVTVPQEPPPADVPPIREVDPAPAQAPSIVAIEPSWTAPPATPAPVALPSPSSIEALGTEFAARSPADEVRAETSFVAFVPTEPASPRPAALKSLEAPASAPAPAPSPSGAAGGSGASPAGGSFGLFAVLAALLILVPSLLSRLLTLSVELMRPTALVFQLKRPG